MRIFQRGDSILIQIEIRDYENDLVDPDTALITIVDPEEEEVITEETMDREDTGKYYYHWNSEDMPRGVYLVKIRVSDDPWMAVDYGRFRLEDQHQVGEGE